MKPLNKSELKTLCQAYEVLNGIRARDGSARCYDEIYFSSIVDGLDYIVYKKTGHSAHCNPLLYKQDIDKSD